VRIQDSYARHDSTRRSFQRATKTVRPRSLSAIGISLSVIPRYYPKRSVFLGANKKKAGPDMICPASLHGLIAPSWNFRETVCWGSLQTHSDTKYRDLDLIYLRRCHVIPRAYEPAQHRNVHPLSHCRTGHRACCSPFPSTSMAACEVYSNVRAVQSSSAEFLRKSEMSEHSHMTIPTQWPDIK